MTTTLIFNTRASIAAADHLTSTTSLGRSGSVTHSPMRAINTEPAMRLHIQDGARFSTGEEECLLPLLESFSTHGSFFDLRSLYKLDEATRMTACQSIMLYANVIREVVSP